MRKFFLLCLSALIALMSIPTTAQAATVVLNSTPASGFFYGTGNGYNPANSSVLTAGAGNEIALRFHQTFVAAPRSDNNGVYTFALGTTPLSFDWSLSSSARSALTSSLITITNLRTGGTFAYNPFFTGNDNAVLESTLGSTFQNSARLTFAFLAPVGFDPNVRGRYEVNFKSDFVGQGVQSLSVFAQLGAVPEPATWAMLIVGFGFVGNEKRRRRTGMRTVNA